MLTHAKAKLLLESAANKSKGKPLGGDYYLVKNKNDYLVIKNYKTFLKITSKNEYYLGLVTTSTYSWMNKFIPGKIKSVKKELFYNNVPFFQGMVLTSNGDIKIEEAWSEKKEYDLCCEGCAIEYSSKRCESCLGDHLDSLREDAAGDDEYDDFYEDGEYEESDRYINNDY